MVSRLLFSTVAVVRELPSWFVVEREDGRGLEGVVTGPADAPLLVWHVGTPMAACPFPALDEVAAGRGLRVATYSRPGYAGSTPSPGRSVADAAADTLAVVGALGADTFLTIGWSGGGPHALACAALLPDRCRAAASVGGLAPYRAPGLDWFDGMAEDNVAEFSAAVAGADELSTMLEGSVASLSDLTATGLAEALGGLASDVDRAVLDGDFGAYVAASFSRAGTAGGAGWYGDDLAFAAAWGFDLTSIETPVAVWHGAQDRMVPWTHGRWLIEHIPGAHAHLHNGEGHLSLVVHHLGDVVDDLMAMASG